MSPGRKNVELVLAESAVGSAYNNDAQMPTVAIAQIVHQRELDIEIKIFKVLKDVGCGNMERHKNRKRPEEQDVQQRQARPPSFEQSLL